jgi:Putative Flp pilus-assembly TadE/G-like
MRMEPYMMLHSASRGRSAALPAAGRGSANPARRGFVLITMLCCLVVLVAFLGLAIDAGYLELVKTRMQTAADAAALGGVQEIKMNGVANLLAAARNDAALNGFTDGQHAVTVTVHNPPSGGYSAADSTGVEVVVAQQVSTFFMGIVGSWSVNLQARAVAHQGSGTTCLHVLDQAAAAAFSASGGANVQISCGVQVESASATAFKVWGGTTVTASSIGVFGGSSVVNATVTPTPVTGTPRQGDPLAYVLAPAVGNTCPNLNTSIGGGLTRTLNPGIYCNGITLSNGSNITFNPGTYILKGGGLDIGGGVTATGSGVTFYNTAGGGYTYGPFTFHNGPNITFSAPTTGPLAGILFFQDRGIVSPLVNSLFGGSTFSLVGSLYFPTTPISYSGGTNVSGTYSIIVAKTATFSGGCKMNNDYSSLPGGNPIKGNALISE